MTETQAKSGVTGTSTDAADSPVDAAPTADESKADAPVSASAASSGAADEGRDDGPSVPSPSSSPRSDSSFGSAPSSGSGSGGSGSLGASALGDGETTVRAPVDVPVVAGYGSSRSTGSSVVPPSASHATGTASVSSTGSHPVVARASVAPSSGTALRTATGSSPVVTPSRPASSAVGAARVSDAVRTARATVAGAARGPRRARLHLKRIDPWSVMKFSFAVSLVLFVVAIVATSVLYLALDAMGVFTSLNQAMAEITGEAGAAADTFKVTAKGVIGTSVLLGAVNMVLFTALMTLGAFVYNVCADLVGGIEVTLSEKE